MDPLLTLLIFLGGIAAGTLNTVAGGGGLIALPLLIFAGVPATVANGTYRLAVTLQNVSALSTFHRRGVGVIGESRLLLVPCLLGAVLGVRLAVHVDETMLRRLLGLVLVVMLVPILRPRPKPKGEPRRLRAKPWMMAAYFALGVYGGFIQAGVGFFFLALLAGVSGLDLVRANAIKVFLILGYSLLAVVLFILGGRFAVVPAIALALGNMIGGWLGAHLAIEKGERWIRWALVAAVTASAVKLSGIGFR